MNAAWPTSTGGHQLMANLLFWNIGLALPDRSRFLLARTTAFHIVRFQLLLAYLATTLHKLQGHAWLDGSALSQVASIQPGRWAGWQVCRCWPGCSPGPRSRSRRCSPWRSGGRSRGACSCRRRGLPCVHGNAARYTRDGCRLPGGLCAWLPEGTARTILEAPRAAVRQLSPTS